VQVYSVRLLVRLRWLPLPVFGSVFGIKIVPSVEHWYCIVLQFRLRRFDDDGVVRTF